MVTTSQQDQDQEDGGVVNEESDEQLVEFEFDCDDKGNKVNTTHCTLYWCIAIMNYSLFFVIDGSW